MLVLSREIGQSLLIEDVRLTVVRFCESHAEVRLRKISGGRPVLVTLPRKEYVTVCYGVQISFVRAYESKIWLGVFAPREIQISREELLER